MEEVAVTCPYCGEAFTTLVDCSAGTQRYIEDCQVCCRPIELAIQVSGEDGALTGVQARREDD